jgi:hypothetical protein
MRLNQDRLRRTELRCKTAGVLQKLFQGNSRESIVHSELLSYKIIYALHKTIVSLLIENTIENGIIF